MAVGWRGRCVPGRDSRTAANNYAVAHLWLLKGSVKLMCKDNEVSKRGRVASSTEIALLRSPRGPSVSSKGR
jgi:hypothetical protein